VIIRFQEVQPAGFFLGRALEEEEITVC